MKLTLPVFGNFYCGNDVALSIQLIGESDWLVVKCTERNQAWGDNGVYSTFGIIEFDTEDLRIEKSNVLSEKAPCIRYEDIKFTAKTDQQMKDWFFEHYKSFKGE